MYVTKDRFIKLKGQDFYDANVRGVLGEAEATERFEIISNAISAQADGYLIESYDDLPLSPVPLALELQISDILGYYFNDEIIPEINKTRHDLAWERFRDFCSRKAFYTDDDEPIDELRRPVAVKSSTPESIKKFHSDIWSKF